MHPKLNDIDRPKHEDDPFFDGSDTSKNLSKSENLRKFIDSMDKMMNDSAPLKMDKMNIDSVPQKFEKGYDKFLVKYAKYNKKGNPKQHPRLHGIVEHPDEGVK